MGKRKKPKKSKPNFYGALFCGTIRKNKRITVKNSEHANHPQFLELKTDSVKEDGSKGNS